MTHWELSEAVLDARGRSHDLSGEAARPYSATYTCPHCGQPHLVAGGLPGLGLVIEHGPDYHAGTAAELWPRGDYPPAVAETLEAMTWCAGVGKYVEMGEPERLVAAPG